MDHSILGFGSSKHGYNRKSDRCVVFVLLGFYCLKPMTYVASKINGRVCSLFAHCRGP